MGRVDPPVRKRKIKLTEEQIRALERFLVAGGRFFAGTLKGVGKVYIQSVLDCFSGHV